jgi:prolyl-tRNA synthetase
LGIQADKSTDFPKWYQQVVKRSELIEYYDISGCYILRPLAYSMWESIQVHLHSASPPFCIWGLHDACGGV